MKFLVRCKRRLRPFGECLETSIAVKKLEIIILRKQRRKLTLLIVQQSNFNRSLYSDKKEVEYHKEKTQLDMQEFLLSTLQHLYKTHQFYY